MWSPSPNGCGHSSRSDCIFHDSSMRVRSQCRRSPARRPVGREFFLFAGDHRRALLTDAGSAGGFRQLAERTESRPPRADQWREYSGDEQGAEPTTRSAVGNGVRWVAVVTPRSWRVAAGRSVQPPLGAWWDSAQQ